jgi:hypothetical protein
MKLVNALAALALLVAVSACTEKHPPNKLTEPAPGQNAAPTTSTW